MTFRDRIHAAELLADQLGPYRDKHPLVLGIPRGSVPMGKTLADRLEGDFDVLLVHKLGAPDNPEFAIGSVSEAGTVYQSEAVGLYGISPQYVDEAARAEIEKLKKKRQAYSPVRPPISPKDRTVIIVDDGIATGATMLAAVRAVRAQKPKRVIIAAPVASPRAVESLRRESDEMVILDTPADFYAISEFYEDFPQVTDEEVLRVLSEKKRPYGEQAA